MKFSLDPSGCIGVCAVKRVIREKCCSAASDAIPSDEEWPRPAVSEQTLRDVLGGAGWDIETLEPATRRREIDGDAIEMALWYVRAQRRTLA